MKNKKLTSALIFLAIAVVFYIAASLIFCYTTKPAIATGEFPFSITYEYKGETGTLSGVYKCRFYGSHTFGTEHDRHWEGESIIDNPGEFDYPNMIDQTETTSLSIFEYMSAGYFMGDPLHQDYYQVYGLEGPEPYVEYFDYENEISLNEDNRDEILKELDFKIIDYSYPEPIENSFSFSGVSYSADNVPIFVLIALIFLIVCIIFARKDKDYTYSTADKLGIFFNFILGLFAYPFISVFCWFYGIIGGESFLCQTIYNTPFISYVGLAMSVVLRRKGFRKTSLIVQFTGTAIFVLIMVSEAILYWFY